MKMSRFYILSQRYPTHCGDRPLSWAIYYGFIFKRFCGYSWSYVGAQRAIELIKRGMRGIQR